MNENNMDYIPEDVRQQSVSQAEMMLSPEVPEEERKHFLKFLMLFNRNIQLGYLEERWLYPLKQQFDIVVELYEMEMYEKARIYTASILNWIGLTAGLHGFKTLTQSGSLQLNYQKDMQRNMQITQKKSLTGKLSGIFGKHKKEPEGGLQFPEGGY